MLKLALAILLLAGATQAADLSGAPRIIDGDTLAIGDTRIRLNGIDAPELRQSCDGLPKAGRLAKQLLDDAAGPSVTCRPAALRDKYGRVVATCRGAYGRDLGEIMVRAGLAWRYGKLYRTAEAQARAERRGVWGARCVPPAEWRKGVR